MKIIPEIAAGAEELGQIRRDIHAHPELGFEESRTSDLVAGLLESWGIEVHRGLAGTGVVGTLRVGEDKRAIGLRADMDALPIQEANDFAHRSRNEGKMHACGHDGHTTMLLGAAKYLAETRDFDGAVHFVFQPAEEGLGGARAMVEQGLFRDFPMQRIYGMHNTPSLGPGRFAIRAGPMMAGGAFFDIEITGRGAHGARPEGSVDPVVVAAQIITALQTIVARNAPPREAAVVSVTRLHAGEAYNVIPGEARLGGTVRVFSAETMALVERRMAELSGGIARSFGATARLDFREIFRPLVNDAEETAFAAEVAAELVGPENVERERSLVMASEDFSDMLAACPGAYIYIGNGDETGQGGEACQVHNAGYDFNDAILPLGASYWSRLVETKLARERPAG